MERTNSFKVVASFGNALLEEDDDHDHDHDDDNDDNDDDDDFVPVVSFDCFFLVVCILNRRIGSMDFFGTSNLDVMSMQLQGEGEIVAPVNRCAFTL